MNLILCRGRIRRDHTNLALEQLTIGRFEAMPVRTSDRMRSNKVWNVSQCLTDRSLHTASIGDQQEGVCRRTRERLSNTPRDPFDRRTKDNHVGETNNGGNVRETVIN